MEHGDRKAVDIVIFYLILCIGEKNERKKLEPSE